MSFWTLLVGGLDGWGGGNARFGVGQCRMCGDECVDGNVEDFVEDGEFRREHDGDICVENGVRQWGLYAQ